VSSKRSNSSARGDVTCSVRGVSPAPRGRVDGAAASLRDGVVEAFELFGPTEASPGSQLGKHEPSAPQPGNSHARTPR
jgi:hypothetical protein